MSGKIVVIGLAAIIGQISAVFMFEFPWWIPLLNLVFAGGLFGLKVKPETNFVVTGAHFMLCVASVAFSPGLFWLALTATATSIAFLVKRFWGL